MDTTKKEEKRINVFQKILDDKRAIRECLLKGGDLKALEKERGFRFVTPI